MTELLIFLLLSLALFFIRKDIKKDILTLMKIRNSNKQQQGDLWNV
jgi:hypothetical protein